MFEFEEIVRSFRGWGFLNLLGGIILRAGVEEEG